MTEPATPGPVSQTTPRLASAPISRRHILLAGAAGCLGAALWTHQPTTAAASDDLMIARKSVV